MKGKRSWLSSLFGRKSSDEQDEVLLKDQVSAEQAKLSRNKARAEKVLDDFYRADKVIRGGGGT